MVVALLVSNLCYGQVACPPGMSAYGTGNDQSACGYDDSQPEENMRNQVDPPPIWSDQWMAIATDSAKASLGTATYMSSRELAESKAVEDCQKKGGLNCKLQMSTQNGCAAMILGKNAFNVNSAETITEAIDNGMRQCKSAGDQNCRVYYSACSLPVRIQ